MVEQMNRDEPLPCPFCGNAELGCYQLNYGGSPWVIRCDSMSCFVKPFAALADTRDKAVALWNRRAK